MKRYLVTRVETVTVDARNEEDALLIAGEALDFFGPETSDWEAEELEPNMHDGVNDFAERQAKFGGPFGDPSCT